MKFIVIFSHIFEYFWVTSCYINVMMDEEDFISNLDWDPFYLARIFDVDFYDMSELWNDPSAVSDSEIVHAMDTKYCPIVEDISVDDECLYDAVQAIENE